MSKNLDLNKAAFLSLAHDIYTMCRMNSQSNCFCTRESRLWAIVLVLPNAQYRIIARFRNRQDADDCLRFLRRSVPAAKFNIVFDDPACVAMRNLKLE
jgi:hypothetical protein